MQIIRSSNETVSVGGDDGRTVYAYFSTFGNPYTAQDGKNAPHTEIVERGAFLINPNAKALAEHDHNRLLGLCKTGNVELIQDDVGLLGKIKMPNTTDGNNYLEMAKRGEVGCSFGGTTISRSNKNGVVTLNKIRVNEVSFTFQPANSSAGVVMIRSNEMAIEEEMDSETEIIIQNYYANAKYN